MNPNERFANSVDSSASASVELFQQPLHQVDRTLANTPSAVTAIQFQTFFEHSSDAILLLDHAGQCLDANTAACTLFGLSKAELVVQKIENFIELGFDLEQGQKPSYANRTITGAIRVRFSSEIIHDVEYTGICNILPHCHLLLAKGVSDRKQAELDQQRAMQRERYISAIAQNIRQSLSLDYILSTAVEEVQQFLQVDRVLIFRCNSDGSGKVIAEALKDNCFSIINRVIHDSCFAGAMLPAYKQGRIHTVSDILTANLEPCYVNALTELQVRAVLAMPILVGQELWGLLVAHQCTSPHQWQQLDGQLLQQFSTQMAISIHQAELYQQMQQQAQKEQVLNRVTQTIRHSLNLPTIFATAVSEIGSTLQVDRTSIVQYLPENKLWRTVANYCRDPQTPNNLGFEVADAGNLLAARLKQFEIVQIDDASLCTDEVNQRLAQTFPGAWLLVPLQIELNTADGYSHSIWGSLSLFKSRPSPWQKSDLDLACAIANQLSIAIQQSQLFQQVQQLNQQLGQLVQAQTDQLQKALEFEAVLKRITDKVRDSLDEAQILQSVVQELVQGLEIRGCDVALHDLEQRISVIRYEHISQGIPSAQGQVISLDTMAQAFAQLCSGQTFQFCQIVADAARPVQKQFAILDCPIIDDQSILGDMWLLRPNSDVFSDEEIRLIQQVANQCAIAIRQARLYQAAQAQVIELEQLNQLKDDFLSTVSHELRSPITSIKMAIQMLEISLTQLGVLESEPVRRYFQILQDECQREISLINNLLDLCRLDAVPESLTLSSVDLASWIPHLTQPFLERAQSQQQTLTLSLPAQLPNLMTDLSSLQRIFTELLTNACKYTPSGETIAVVVQEVDRAVQISVCNSGVEISTSEIPRIFDKFYRIPNRDPWRHGGTGLGLALVKKLAEQIGAAIQVSSFARQTTFTVTIPIRLTSRNLQQPTTE